MNNAIVDKFFKRGRDFLGTHYPVMCGAMTWVSEPKLVSGVSNAGGFGCLAGGNTPIDILRGQIEQTRRLTDKPFAVNLITIAPLYKEHLALVKEMDVPFIIFAGSFPREKEIRIAKQSGAKVLTFASTQSIAERMIGYGVDGLILEGMEAGGHVGHVTLTILLQQVLFNFDQVPIFVAGGLASGRMCAHLLLMGAAGVQFGTRFAVATESIAHKKFKERFIKANARDAVSTPQIDSRLPVVAVRALRNRGHADFSKLQMELLKRLESGSIGRVEAQLEVESYWVGALRRAVMDGDTDYGSLMAGQSVGLITKEQSIQEIVDEVVGDIGKEFNKIHASLHLEGMPVETF
ncbi:MAG: hypothetical protein GF398_14805 [Chitinivibrionales bacterium]|nr:hypothetical protein [Chitinivibrionales bacterium]